MSKPPESGRKKGTPNKLSLLKVKEVLLLHGKNPAEEILKLMPHLMPDEQLKAWGLLLTYSQAKPQDAPEDQEDKIAEIVEALKGFTNEQLAGMTKQLPYKGEE